MVIFELTIEKHEEGIEKVYIVPNGNQMSFYRKIDDSPLEKIPLENRGIGWNIRTRGGNVYLRDIVDSEYKEIKKQIDKASE